MQPRKFQSKAPTQQQSGADKVKELNLLPTTPFTFNELQALNLEDAAFKKYLKRDPRIVSQPT